MSTPVLTWNDIAEFIDSLTPEQRNNPALLWDANNDAGFVANAADVSGNELPDDVAPSDDFVSIGQPYLVYCL